MQCLGSERGGGDAWDEDVAVMERSGRMERSGAAGGRDGDGVTTAVAGATTGAAGGRDGDGATTAGGRNRGRD